MLSVELMKKIFESVEVKGFTADNLGLNNIHGSCFGWGLLNGEGNDLEGLAKWMYIYYPLFLQRVIEGMNKDKRISIEQRKRDILVGINGKYEKTFYLIPTDIAKENTIKYILDKI